MPSNLSSSVVPFSCLQSFPAAGSFPVSSAWVPWPAFLICNKRRLTVSPSQGPWQHAGPSWGSLPEVDAQQMRAVVLKSTGSGAACQGECWADFPQCIQAAVSLSLPRNLGMGVSPFGNSGADPFPNPSQELRDSPNPPQSSQPLGATGLTTPFCRVWER